MQGAAQVWRGLQWEAGRADSPPRSENCGKSAASVGLTSLLRVTDVLAAPRTAAVMRPDSVAGGRPDKQTHSMEEILSAVIDIRVTWET